MSYCGPRPLDEMNLSNSALEKYKEQQPTRDVISKVTWIWQKKAISHRLNLVFATSATASHLVMITLEHPLGSNLGVRFPLITGVCQPMFMSISNIC